MSKLLFLALISFGLIFPVQAQTLKQLHKQMKLIPPGTYEMGGGYQYEAEETRMIYLESEQLSADQNPEQIVIGEVPMSNNPTRIVTVSSFLLCESEVTNFQYRDFLVESILDGEEKRQFLDKLRELEKEGSEKVVAHWKTLNDRAGTKGLLPDLTCWEKDFPRAHNKPLAESYFWHPAFNNYPVVGVNWEQANAFCAWLTRINEEDRTSRGLSPGPAFRLPTEAEWEYAAQGVDNPMADGDSYSRNIYPWEGTRMWDRKGEYRANLRAEARNYGLDGHVFPSPITNYAPNGFGLYDMAGNVSEWTMDVFRINEFSEENMRLLNPKFERTDAGDDSRVVKGGSWADLRYAAHVGSRCRVKETEGHSRVGFRIAMTVTRDLYSGK